MPAALLILITPAHAAPRVMTLPVPAVRSVPAANKYLPVRIKHAPIRHIRHPRGDFDPPLPRSRSVEAIRFTDLSVSSKPGSSAVGTCDIMKSSDPEDAMAFSLWSAYVGSPRHATRLAWDKFDAQPVFFRMAQAALAICGAEK